MGEAQAQRNMTNIAGKACANEIKTNRQPYVIMTIDNTAKREIFSIYLKSDHFSSLVLRKIMGVGTSMYCTATDRQTCTEKTVSMIYYSIL